MMKIPAITLLTAALLATAGCSSSGGTASTASTSSQVATSDGENLRCKTVVKTGTRLGTRVCKSEAQWEQEARTSREATENIQRTSTHGSSPPGA